MSLATRNMVEWSLRLLRITEQQARGYRFAGERGIDISSLPILAQKAYAGERDVDEIWLAMAHVTGVTAGYGVQKWGKTGWKRWLPVVQETKRLFPTGAWTSKCLPIDLCSQLAAADLLDLPDLELAKLVALMSRFRNTPYHFIGSRAGYIFENRRQEQCTHHGQGARKSGGNQGIGVAFDCSPSTELTPFLIQTFQATLRLAHLRWLERQHETPTEDAPKLTIVTHAQAKYPGRAKDPGHDIYWLVIVPTVEWLVSEGHQVIIDLSWSYGSGRPFPKWALKRAA